jgi:hypothetical protein
MTSAQDRTRKLAAKRNNEHIKLVATVLNALCIALIGAAVIVPSVSSPEFFLTTRSWILILAAFVLHLGAHAVLRLLRSED